MKRDMLRITPTPLEATQPPRALADPDSQFIEINDLDVHVKTRGQGEPVFVLLHGFASSLYTWEAVMEPLSQYGMLIAFDRPAFGLTERPLTWEGQNPYSPEAQLELVKGLLDHFGVEQAILVGHSAGGTVAMQMALAYPRRVRALVLVDPAVYNGGGPPEWIRPLLASSLMRRLGLLVTRQIQKRGPKLLQLAWHDPTRLQPEMIELYKKPLQVENWDRALWEFTLASRDPGLAEHLDKLSLPVLVISGDNDRIVPTADSIRLSKELPDARLAVIADAGHVPQEERPADFMQAVENFLQSFFL
jgi:pimeloyl-ACP methyl ester carboxylesterase